MFVSVTVGSFDRIRVVTWVPKQHIRFAFAVALAELDSLSLAIDGQDWVAFGFVLGFATSMQHRVTEAFAVRVDAVELTYFERPRLFVDVKSNSV